MKKNISEIISTKYHFQSDDGKIALSFSLTTKEEKEEFLILLQAAIDEIKNQVE